MGAENKAAGHAGNTRTCEGKGDTGRCGGGEGSEAGSNDQGDCRDWWGGAAGEIGRRQSPAVQPPTPPLSTPVDHHSPTQEELKRGTGLREVEKDVWDSQLRRAQERARSIVGLKSRSCR